MTFSYLNLFKCASTVKILQSKEFKNGYHQEDFLPRNANTLPSITAAVAVCDKNEIMVVLPGIPPGIAS
jgi:hypothetical protein